MLVSCQVDSSPILCISDSFSRPKHECMESEMLAFPSGLCVTHRALNKNLKFLVLLCEN